MSNYTGDAIRQGRTPRSGQFYTVINFSNFELNGYEYYCLIDNRRLIGDCRGKYKQNVAGHRCIRRSPSGSRIGFCARHGQKRRCAWRSRT
jgi:hypothetical protein